MKMKLIIFPALFCLLLLIAGCNENNVTEVEDDYISYFITIINDSSVDITDISFHMIGLDIVVQISDLIPEEISQQFEFQLPEPSGDTPVSYGDYDFSYLQNNKEMYIGIITPDTNILVRINDDGYTVEDVGN